MNLKREIHFRKMNTLPKDVYVEILLKLPLGDVLNFCLTAKRYNVMNNENFWRRKMGKDGYKDLFSKYIPSQKEKYKLAHSDHRLIIREMDSYFEHSLGTFSQYVNVEKYKKDFLSAVYEFREDILTKSISRDRYRTYDVPNYFYELFPRSHFEGFDDFEDLYIFESLIYPLLHKELTENSDDDSDETDDEMSTEEREMQIEFLENDLNVEQIEPGFYRTVSRGFILTLARGGVCCLKVDENDIWRDLNDEEQNLISSMGLRFKIQNEKDKEVEKVTILDDELSIQYIYFDDISMTLHHHFVIYKNEFAFKIAEGSTWRPLNSHEKEIATSLGLKVL